MPNIYRIEVGRLVEVRIDNSIRTVSDVNAWFDAVRVVFDRLDSHVRPVVASDWRDCPVLAPDAAECLRDRLTQTNVRVDRSAALVSSKAPIPALQLARVVRQSQNSNRRTFTEAAPFVQWLAEALTPREVTRLRQFLVESDRKSVV